MFLSSLCFCWLLQVPARRLCVQDPLMSYLKTSSSTQVLGFPDSEELPSPYQIASLTCQGEQFISLSSTSEASRVWHCGAARDWGNTAAVLTEQSCGRVSLASCPFFFNVQASWYGGEMGAAWVGCTCTLSRPLGPVGSCGPNHRRSGPRRSQMAQWCG